MIVNEVIPQFSVEQQAGWRKQADSWRLPFWDWARKGRGRCPDLAKTPTINV